MIKVKPDITEDELLKEIEAMSWKEIMEIPLTGRFTGLFKTFEEISKITTGSISNNDEKLHKN